MTDKPFKTHRQQLNILRSRNLDVGNTSKTMRYLETENYYDLINGYKSPFLIRDKSGNVIHPEKFENGASLDEIHYLYEFDRNLRMIFLKYFLTFESNLKSRVSYRFSEKFSQRNAYLDFNNFSDRSNKLKDVFITISILSSTISKYATKKGTSIAHYVDEHDEVPLWVLVDYLSMGNISYFYSSMIDTLKNQIAQDFNSQYNHDYQLPHGETLGLRDSHLEGIVRTINLFRNTCAHEEILYKFKVLRPKNTEHIRSIFKNFDFPTKNDLFTVYIMLKLVLRKRDFYNMRSELKHMFDKFKVHFKTVVFNDILKLMGFPENWDNF